MTKASGSGGGGRVYLAYSSALLFTTEGSQDWNSNRAGAWWQALMHGGHGVVLVTGLLLMAGSVCFLMEPRPIRPGLAPSTVGWTPTAVTQCSTASSLGEFSFSVEGPSFQMTSMCQVDLREAS